MARNNDEGKPLRVAVLGRFPPPFHGQAVSTAVLADLLEERGVRVLRIDEDLRKADRKRLEARAGALERLADLRQLLRLVVRIRRQLRGFRPEVLVYGSMSATGSGHIRNLLVLSFAIPVGVPILAPIHNGDIGRLADGQVSRHTWRWLGRRVHALVPLSSALARGLRSDARLHIISNTLDPVFDESPTTPPPDLGAGGGLHLLYLSNLLPEKGVFRALHAADRLAERMPVRLEVIGSAPSRSVLDEFKICAARSGAEVAYRGPIQDRHELREAVVAAGVLVFPSHYRHEAQPMVILEALASGIPVVATSIGGIPDIVRDGRTGYLVDPNDADGLVTRLADFADEALRLKFGRAGRLDYEERFSRDVVARHWMAAILDAVTGAER
jgi:glycosyltransferase involved in cell wall biosynthesis